jgi:hypothetical protein
VAFPTNRLKVAHIVEQVKVAFVGLNVVDDCGLRLGAATL